MKLKTGFVSYWFFRKWIRLYRIGLTNNHEKIVELNKLNLPIVKIDKLLGKYKDKVLFKEKVEKANETLKSVGLPKALQKSKA